MADLTIDRDYKAFIGVRINYTLLTGGAGTPTSYPVSVAVVPEGVRPTSGDYVTATWSSGNAGYVAGLLVGPGSTIGALTPGARYDVFAKVAAATEIPVVQSPDTLVIQ